MKLETKRFLKLKLLYLGPDRLKSLHSFRSTLLGTRPAESYNMNYTYALTSWWGVRPPSPAKETKNSPMTKKERNNSKLGDVGLNTHHFWSKNPCFLVFFPLIWWFFALGFVPWIQWTRSLLQIFMGPCYDSQLLVGQTLFYQSMKRSGT